MLLFAIICNGLICCVDGWCSAATRAVKMRAIGDGIYTMLMPPAPSLSVKSFASIWWLVVIAKCRRYEFALYYQNSNSKRPALLNSSMVFKKPTIAIRKVLFELLCQSNAADAYFNASQIADLCNAAASFDEGEGINEHVVVWALTNGASKYNGQFDTVSGSESVGGM